ncbi:hydroxypyruvate isomerase family protein [Pseudaestuariivita atlantica]|uniref:Isomerase n=1 Tax=Pseudaestuariivita atlantica TaxID=1317121 RepID=A0A0L1JNR8_9RHOB|nr:TIM barrel protein [Pseudaestuariivita atlantica]KNG93404.1 isomerase [Pseudaestuariivita atlantica]
MLRFSANLGFLWADRPLPEAIRAAARAGFDAVECHFPYADPVDDIRAALDETGLPMLGLNTRPGDRDAGEFGLSALPGREEEAREAIDQAVDTALALDAGSVHLMAGRARGPAAREAFLHALDHAVTRMQGTDLMLLVEPLNAGDVPGYHLGTTAEAADVIQSVNAPNLRLMFDAYHVARTERDVVATLNAVAPLVGHIQFADAPGRGRPGSGTLDFEGFFAAVAALGWSRPIGAEYLPGGPTGDSLDWHRAQLAAR